MPNHLVWLLILEYAFYFIYNTTTIILDSMRCLYWLISGSIVLHVCNWCVLCCDINSIQPIFLIFQFLRILVIQHGIFS